MKKFLTLGLALALVGSWLSDTAGHGKIRFFLQSSELAVSLGRDGRLIIRGTPRADDLLLRLDQTRKIVEVDDRTNRADTDHSFRLDLVRSIHIFLEAGDDRVILDNSSGSLGGLRPLEIDAGDGDNTVIGSTGQLKPDEITGLANNIKRLKSVLENASSIRERAEKLALSAGQLTATDGVAFTQTAERFSADAQKQLIDPAEALRLEAERQIVALGEQSVRERPSVLPQPERSPSPADLFADRQANDFVRRLNGLVEEASRVAEDESKVGPLVDRMESEINSLTLAADKLDARLQRGPAQTEFFPERRVLQLEQAGNAILAQSDRYLLGGGDQLLVRAERELLGGGNSLLGRADAIALGAEAIGRDADALLETVLPLVAQLSEVTDAKGGKASLTPQAACTFTTTNTISGSGLIIGTSGNDLLIGGALSDIVLGLSGNDRIRGGAGIDLLFGNGGDDDMFGEAGIDLMFGNDGQDCMSGGDGLDLMFGNQGRDFMHGNDGPTVTFTIGAATISIKLGDLMFGNAGDDEMYGDEGLDLMFGNAEKDTMHGDDGADFMFGNQDADIMYGEAGKGITITIGSNPPSTPSIGNFMFGNIGADQMWGGVDKDLMWGNDDKDTMNGDADTDLIFGGNGADGTNGNDGADFIFGNDDNDTMHGDNGIDFIFGNDNDDTMYGDNGIDFMWGNGHRDRMNGNDGADFMFGNQDADTMNGDAGFDLMWGNQGNDTMNGNAGFDFMWGRENNDTMHGDDGIDFLWGNEDNDTIHGDVGMDFIWGNQGNDTMNGNAGPDFMWGKENNDTIHGDDGIDFLWGNEDDDTLHGDLGSDLLWGNQGNDTINGNDGLDLLWGNQGNDIMDGNNGLDFLWGDDGDDNMFGSQGNDLMFGQAGDDCLDGGGGIDLMFGNQGNDRLFGGGGNDFMFGNDGDDCIDGGAGNDLMYGNHDNDTMLGNAGNDIMFGNQGNDTMDGGANSDLMFGNQGNDNMFGGPQIDLILGGTGTDTTSQNGSSGASCPVCSTIPPKCDLKVEKKVLPNPLVSGQPFTVTLDVTNVGAASCSSGVITLTDILPPELKVLTVSQGGSQWNCSVTGANPPATVACTWNASVQPVPPSASLPPVNINGTVTGPAGSSIQNCATVTNLSDANPANNKSCVTSQIAATGVCDREMKKTVTPNPVQSGQQVITTLTVTNVGSVPCGVVGGINLADTQPPGLSFQLPVSANKPGWSCGFTPPGVIAFCTSTSPLLPGTANAVTITFKATVTAAAGSSIQNCAEVTNVGDATQPNNKSCVNIGVN